MTNETPQTHTTEYKPVPFGTRLKSAREAMGLERKDAAAQLRLAEKVIVMMEKDRYPTDLPVTFIRGYIRAYGKLLQIPEYEIKKAIEPIKPKPTPQDPALSVPRPSVPVTSGNYFMQFFTYLIILTLAGLVGMWWYTHSKTAAVAVPESSVVSPPADNSPAPALPSAANPASPPAPITDATEPGNKTGTAEASNKATIDSNPSVQENKIASEATQADASAAAPNDNKPAATTKPAATQHAADEEENASQTDQQEADSAGTNTNNDTDSDNAD